jgi:hypothetical protein
LEVHYPGHDALDWVLFGLVDGKWLMLQGQVISGGDLARELRYNFRGLNGCNWNEMRLSNQNIRGLGRLDARYSYSNDLVLFFPLFGLAVAISGHFQ